MAEAESAPIDTRDSDSMEMKVQRKENEQIQSKRGKKKKRGGTEDISPEKQAKLEQARKKMDADPAYKDNANYKKFSQEFPQGPSGQVETTRQKEIPSAIKQPAKLRQSATVNSLPLSDYDDPCREFDSFAGDWVDSKGQLVKISPWGVIRYPNNPKLRFEAESMGPHHLSVTFDKDPNKRKFVGKLNHECNVLIWSNDTKWTKKSMPIAETDAVQSAKGSGDAQAVVAATRGSGKKKGGRKRKKSKGNPSQSGGASGNGGGDPGKGGPNGGGTRGNGKDGKCLIQ